MEIKDLIEKLGADVLAQKAEMTERLATLEKSADVEKLTGEISSLKDALEVLETKSALPAKTSSAPNLFCYVC